MGERLAAGGTVRCVGGRLNAGGIGRGMGERLDAGDNGRCVGGRLSVAWQMMNFLSFLLGLAHLLFLPFRLRMGSYFSREVEILQEPHFL